MVGGHRGCFLVIGPYLPWLPLAGQDGRTGMVLKLHPSARHQGLNSIKTHNLEFNLPVYRSVPFFLNLPSNLSYPLSLSKQFKLQSLHFLT